MIRKVAINDADTVVLAFKVNVQVAAVPLQAPDQPLKTDPPAGTSSMVLYISKEVYGMFYGSRPIYFYLNLTT